MDELFMKEALSLAKEAFDDGEVPVGCVVVKGEEIVGRGRNRREGEKNALAHAEIEAIHDACRTLGGWRLWECTLYVTLEPTGSPGYPGRFTARRTINAPRCARCAVCLTCASTTTHPWKPGCWMKNALH